MLRIGLMVHLLNWSLRGKYNFSISDALTLSGAEDAIAEAVDKPEIRLLWLQVNRPHQVWQTFLRLKLMHLPIRKFKSLKIGVMISCQQKDYQKV